MTDTNSSISFIGVDLFHDDVPEEWLNVSKCVDKYRKKKAEEFRCEKEVLDSMRKQFQQINKAVLTAQDELDAFKSKKASLLSEITLTKQLLQELIITKEFLHKASHPVVTSEELDELFNRVLKLESEQTDKKEEIVNKANAYKAQMWFYKHHLDMYLDIVCSNEFIFYFRRCKGSDKRRPKEWIQIKTDDFKLFAVVDVSCPEEYMQSRKEEFMKMFGQKVYLRQVIIAAREMFFEPDKTL